MPPAAIKGGGLPMVDDSQVFVLALLPIAKGGVVQEEALGLERGAAIALVGLAQLVVVAPG
eukprot:7516484-Alexandrium_andersonii.AAC.1